MPIRCEIVSQDRMVFEGDADIVLLPGTEGEMGILPNHAPLLSTLKYGVVKVRRSGKEEIFTVAGGIVDVQPDRVVILTDAAENVEEINVARAEAAKRRAEEMLKAGPPPDTDEYLAL
ncbi:MAG: ATP synthase F1 subunit epsilon, partial [Anaerolineales bacterium]